MVATPRVFNASTSAQATRGLGPGHRNALHSLVAVCLISSMSLAQKTLYTVAGLVAAILQLLFEAAFGPGQASRASHSRRRTGNGAHRCSQPRETEEHASLSGQALVRLCRGLQEEVRRKERELTTCKASPATSHLLA